MGIMSPPAKSLKLTRAEQQLTELIAQIGELTGEVRGLKRQRDRTQELADLEDQVANLKREKELLTEQSDRKVRETEHSTGLLRTQVEAERKQSQRDAELAAKAAKLEVREENLQADKDRFAEEVRFQREFMQGEVNRLERMIGEVLARVPKVEIKAGGQASARSRDEKADEE